MPMIDQGIYIDTGDRAYEFESWYYLDFQIMSALRSLEKIVVPDAKDMATFNNKHQYYHYYADHLLYSMGQISNRFVHNGKKDKNKTIHTERKELNRINYKFNEKDFPILSSKQARNTIEHIEENNEIIISSAGGVGGFNIIDEETCEMDIKLLKTKLQPYTMDLRVMKLYIVRKGKATLEIDFYQLEQELFKLRDNIHSFWNLAHEYFF